MRIAAELKADFPRPGKRTQGKKAVAVAADHAFVRRSAFRAGREDNDGRRIRAGVDL